jgi:hypothetical protein
MYKCFHPTVQATLVQTVAKDLAIPVASVHFGHLRKYLKENYRCGARSAITTIDVEETLKAFIKSPQGGPFQPPQGIDLVTYFNYYVQRLLRFLQSRLQVAEIDHVYRWFADRPYLARKLVEQFPRLIKEPEAVRNLLDHLITDPSRCDTANPSLQRIFDSMAKTLQTFPYEAMVPTSINRPTGLWEDGSMANNGASNTKVYSLDADNTSVEGEEAADEEELLIDVMESLMNEAGMTLEDVDESTVEELYRLAYERRMKPGYHKHKYGVRDRNPPGPPSTGTPDPRFRRRFLKQQLWKAKRSSERGGNRYSYGSNQHSFSNRADHYQKRDTSPWRAGPRIPHPEGQQQAITTQRRPAGFTKWRKYPSRIHIMENIDAMRYDENIPLEQLYAVMHPVCGGQVDQDYEETDQPLQSDMANIPRTSRRDSIPKDC